MRTPKNADTAVHLAALGAAVLIASQVAGKTARDAFFLSHFDVSSLPAMVILSSLLSILIGVLTVRLVSILGPNRLFPLAFVCSATLLLLEWAIAGWNPRVAAVMIYLQMGIAGSILISGFWSLLGERFDARSAKRQFTRIVAAGTFGGIVGGFLAERIGSLMGIASVLPILAFLHVLCGMIATGLSSERPLSAKRPGPVQKSRLRGSLGVLRTVPYVRNLALLILFSTMGAALLDYAFKARVSAAHDSSEQLVRIFALFYATIGAGTFLIQLIVSRIAVDRLGVARTVGSLPFALMVGGIGGLLIPGLPMTFAMRGGEAMVRNSLFKSGYEMLYAAVPRRERRATKSILDVGVERLGDLMGAFLIAAVAWIVFPPSPSIVLALAALLGAAGFAISRRLQRGHVQALENSLLSQSTPPPLAKEMKTVGGVLRTFLWKSSDAMPSVTEARETFVPPPAVRDLLLENVRDLRSADPEVVRRVLVQRDLPLALTSHVVSLLAWDEVSTDAADALKRMGPRIIGQLVDALLDPEQEFAIRRRIPRVLVAFDSQRAADGLIAGMQDPRFEVRFHCAGALAQIKERSAGIVIDSEAILAAVSREFEISPEVWRNHRVLDGTQHESDGAIAVEHVFGLLALIYPREPLQIAYGALKSSDDHLRRTSLEYLEQILPLGVWQRMLPLLDEEPDLVAAAD